MRFPLRNITIIISIIIFSFIIMYGQLEAQMSEEEESVPEVVQETSQEEEPTPVETEETNTEEVTVPEEIQENSEVPIEDRTDFTMNATPDGLTVAQSKQEELNYVSGEIILKFKDDSHVGDVAGELITRGQKIETITNDSSLDDLNKKYQLTNLKHLLDVSDNGEELAPGVITDEDAEDLHNTHREEFNQKITNIKSQYPRPTDNVPPPYMGNVYVAKFNSGKVKDIVEDYNRNPLIEYAQPNYIMKPVQYEETEEGEDSTVNDPFLNSSGTWGQPYEDLWGMHRIKSQGGWGFTKGEDIIVGVVDSGVDYNHEEIAENIWLNQEEIPNNNIDDDANGYIDDVRGWNFDKDDNDPMDRHGHGTHVSGTIAAAENGIGIVGVAPLAKIMPLKGLSDGGSGFSSNLAEAIVYGVNNGADVINNSWGCGNPCPSNPIVEDAVRYAHSLGAVVIFAAGNSNKDVKDYSPQNVAESITVGSSNYDDERTFFSNFGQLIDVVAPGGGPQGTPPSYDPYRNILSLKSETISSSMSGGGQLIVEGDYVRQAGTSMAAPHVSGLAALIRKLHPEYSVEQVRQALRGGSDDLGAVGFDNETGQGRINALKALQIQNPLEVIITSPDHRPITGGANQMVDVMGTISGDNLVRWSLDIGIGSEPQAGQWLEFQNSVEPVKNGILSPMDLSSVPDGTYTLRLRGLQALPNGWIVYENRQALVIDRVVLEEPSQNEIQFFRVGDRIDIVGTVGMKQLDHYKININFYDNAYTPLPNANVTLTNGGTQKVFNGLLGTWDTSGVPHDHYQILLSVFPKPGSNIPVRYESTHVIVDGKRVQGFPISFPAISAGGAARFAVVDHIDVADINADGADEIIFAYGSNVQVIDGTGQNIEGWPQSITTLNTDDFIQFSPAVGDLTGDGFPEIVAATTQGDMYVWQSDGTPLSGWPRDLGDINLLNVAIDDIHLDGTNFIIATNSRGKVYVMDKDGNAPLYWPRYFSSPSTTQVFLPPSIGDIDNNPSNGKEIVLLERSAPSTMHVVDSRGLPLPGWPKQINPSPPNLFYLAVPILGDLDNDGDLEIIIGSGRGENNVYAYHHDGSSVSGWPGNAYFNDKHTAAIGDIDGDGDPEVFIGNDTGQNYVSGGDRIYALNSDGTPYLPFGGGLGFVSACTLPSAQCNNGVRHSSFGVGAIILADVDNDGKPEVIASSDSFYRGVKSLQAYNEDGSEVESFPKPTTGVGDWATNTAAVGDIDGDGKNELIWVNYDWLSFSLNINAWDLDTPTAGANNPWPMFHHDAQHTGRAR